MYGESDDITGGMGLEGVAEFEKFVKAGGVLVTLGTASYFPAEFGLAPKVDAARTSAQFYAPGPIVDAEILSRSIRSSTATTRRRFRCATRNGPLLSVQTGANPFEPPPPGPPPTPQVVLMRYPGGDDHVLSGLMRGAERNPEPRGDRRRTVRQGTRHPVRRQPVLPVAELRRVQHAVQHGAELQRHQDAA